MGMSVTEVVVEPRLIFSHHVLRGQYLLQAGTVGGGALGWFRQVLGLRGRDLRIALRGGRRPPPPGSGGLVFLPYLAGERTPIWSTTARGVFLGLSYATTRAEMLRSIMEGCAFAVLDNLRVAEATGVRVTEWLATGGAARSPRLEPDQGRRDRAAAGRRPAGGRGRGRSWPRPVRPRGGGGRPRRRRRRDRRAPAARRTTFEPDAGDGMPTTRSCSRCTTTCPAGCCRHSTGSRRCRRCRDEGRGPRGRAPARAIARSRTRCPGTARCCSRCGRARCAARTSTATCAGTGRIR